ncbi:MAG: alpha/beta hydrolase [Ruminococcaceae bacterium]|nr:alpha/beta hydrolase [Oscillospiraceae bacterium]
MTIKLWENDIPYFNEEAETPNMMTAFIRETDKPLPAVIVFPGGGYVNRARHEAEPIAEYYYSMGFHAFVVEYRVSPNRYPAPLIDAQRAIKIVRYNAKKWNVDPDKIITLGFSAGGHLCAMTLTMDDVCTVTGDEIDKMSAKVNGGILCYALTNVEEGYGHVGAGKNLLGDSYEDLKADYSLEKKVTADTPPCFIWHTFEDPVVNVKNALFFADKLKENNVSCEMHIFPNGRHGLGMGDRITDDIKEVRQWAKLSSDWITRTFEE